MNDSNQSSVGFQQVRRNYVSQGLIDIMIIIVRLMSWNSPTVTFAWNHRHVEIIIHIQDIHFYLNSNNIYLYTQIEYVFGKIGFPIKIHISPLDRGIQKGEGYIQRGIYGGVYTGGYIQRGIYRGVYTEGYIQGVYTEGYIQRGIYKGVYTEGYICI